MHTFFKTHTHTQRDGWSIGNTDDDTVTPGRALIQTKADPSSRDGVWDGLHPWVKYVYFSLRNYSVTFMNVWEPHNAMCLMKKEGLTV